MIYITNAFSLNMLSHFPVRTAIEEISLGAVRAAVVGGAVDGGDYYAVTLRHGILPAVGHADTASIVDGLLGLRATDAVTGEAYPPSAAALYGASVLARATVSLSVGDVLYVAQYRGPRLPEGTTTLPDGACIVWYRVDIS